MEKIEYRNIYNLEKYHWWFVGRLKILNDNLPADGASLKLLDVGCGTGLVAVELSKRGYDVYGMDIMNAALKYCKLRKLNKLVKGDVLNLPFKKESFDIITCLDVLYHQKVSDDNIALKEVLRVLKPGGKLIITSCACKLLSGRHDKLVHTRERYNLKELCAKLEKCGFEIEKASYFHTFLFPFVYIMRKIDNMMNKNKPAKSDIKKSNAITNFLLKYIFYTEIAMLKKINLPFGISLLCIAKKPIS